ncbi:MAG: 3-methylitaconate isomerase [Candidatus Tectomicrobia bacterium]|nr:3-methylitaconate isomerase [Candidatus Tectomicrobia bacterium]
MQAKIPCVIMRGGTSKALFFKEPDLPEGREAREQILLAVFGSPDPRQIDGLGGADPLTSKCAIVAPSSEPGVDVNYTFAQVAVDRPFVDWRGNCGNISSAVGLFAAQEGWVELAGPSARVRVLNTNTGKILEIDVPVRDGAPVEEGDTSIPGVPGTAPPIRVGFLGAGGAVTGKLLPTGKPIEEMEVADLGRVALSVVDAANPLFFVRAEDVGWTGSESAAEMETSGEALARLEKIRGEVARRLGFVADPARARAESPAVPKVAVVAPPADYPDASGKTVPAESHDLRGRMLSMGRAHKAYALTGAICTAAAAFIEGTLVNRIVREARGGLPRTLRIGHPAGVIEVEAEVRDGELLKATVIRTARRLMEGFVCVPAGVLSPAGR